MIDAGGVTEAAQPSQVRTALYLDFDNVFTGLRHLDPGAAIRFAEEPRVWLERLASSATVSRPRRWLVLRCYMNPAGSIADGPGQRIYFSKFRPFFTGAGFDVIDCPRLTHTKNAADIRLVVDAVDALRADVVYDEFVIASGDSDMTPLLVRLRAADRRTTIVSPSDAAAALVSVADRLIDGQALLDLVQGEDLEDEDDIIVVAPARRAAPPDEVPKEAGANGASRRSSNRFRELVESTYARASSPINLAVLAQDLRRELGAEIDKSQWFGHGTLVRALESLELADFTRSQHHLWDASRHEPPAGAGANPGSDGPGTTNSERQPEPVARLSALLNLPRLPAESWPPVYNILAEYASTHDFTLTEATRWSRDRLVERGVDANRTAVGFVTRGAAFGGCPVFRQPPPTAEEIGDAFVRNVLDRTDAASMALSPADRRVVAEWLGRPLVLELKAAVQVAD
jgi:uncharacterized LabA/DUF88 family protein